MRVLRHKTAAVVTSRVAAPEAFWLWVVCVNWGRHYKPGEFKANVHNVLRKVDGKGHVVIGVQELDEEPDLAPEHKVFADMLEPGTHRVAWGTSEPIVLSPAFEDVGRERVKVTMESGGKIGAPKGTGPTRHSVTCAVNDGRIRLGFGNTHPHRNLPNPAVQKARRQGALVFSQELRGLYRSGGGTSTVWMADANDASFDTMIPGERTAIHRGLDWIRFKQHPKGALLDLRDVGTLQGTIDPHDPLWALFRVVQRAA